MREASSLYEYNRSIYEGQAAVSDHARSGLQPAEKILFEKYFRAPGRMLDIGCGTGRTSIVLSEKGLLVEAIDYAQAMIDEARKSFPDAGINFTVMDVADLKFPDASFEYAFFSFNGLDHMHPKPLRLQALREIRRVLKPSGIYAFNSHSSLWIPNLWYKRWNMMRSFMRGKIAPYRLDFHPFGDVLLYYTSPWAERHELAQAGFELVEIITVRTQRKSPLIIAVQDPYPMYVCRAVGAGPISHS